MPIAARWPPIMIAVPASELSIHLNKKTGIRRLRFTSSLGNVGVGPIEVRPNQKQPCPVGQRNATQIVYRDLNVDRLFEPLIDTSGFRHRAGSRLDRYAVDFAPFPQSRFGRLVLEIVPSIEGAPFVAADP